MTCDGLDYNSYLRVMMKEYMERKELDIEDLAVKIDISAKYLKGIVDGNRDMGVKTANKIYKFITGQSFPSSRKPVRVCLKCDKEFRAQSQYNRLCYACKEDNSKEADEYTCTRYNITLRARGGMK